MTDEYEVERTVPRDEAATILHGVADGVAAGAMRLGSGDDERTVEIPDEVDLEVEFETEGDQLSLEVELEWPESAVEGEQGAVGEAGDPPAESEDAPEADPGPDEADHAPTRADVERDEADDSVGDPVAEGAPEGIAEPALGTAARQVSLGRFELFEDRGGEWRWRLVHRNGNVIATSGEGYTRKHNARKGLRSVMRNAEGAVVTERPDE